MIKPKHNLIVFFFATALMLPAMSSGAADAPALSLPNYIDLNQNFSSSTSPITVKVSREQVLSYHWQAGQLIRVQIYVEDKKNAKHFIRDTQGQRAWNLMVKDDLSGSISVIPALNNYTGRLTFLGNEKVLSAPTPNAPEEQVQTLEKVCEGRLEDGAAVKVHYTDQILEEVGVAVSFPQQVLEAAVTAYQTITRLEGFGTSGYSFSDPDKTYVYDPDKTIDIYLGNSNADNGFKFHGFTSAAYRDAPCFDTVKFSARAYGALILLPVNYREYIKNWEQMNPSSLGPRNINVDLRGTLIHEMLHVVLFYYNKNLNRESNDISPEAIERTTSKKSLDWYVEGLARYFETFAGARHDFYSQGFRETLPNKIRFSRGGSNYFMRYPDQPFTELRYENALFWRFIDYQFGMKTIETLSRALRQADPLNFKQSLESATNTPSRSLLKKFSKACLLNDFGLKEDAVYLREVARTKLLFKEKSFYLLDGYGDQKKLGPACGTDWVGEWAGFKAHLEELPVGGDNTNACDVSAWATDYYEIAVAPKEKNLPVLKIKAEGPGVGLMIQLLLRTRGGSMITHDWDERADGTTSGVDLESLAAQEGLAAEDIEKIFILVTNLDAYKSSNYEIISTSSKIS